MAIKLGVKENTIRRWSDQLEQAGYALHRIGLRRTYTEQDVKYFRRLRKVAEKLSLEDAARETVAGWEKDQQKAAEAMEETSVVEAEGAASEDEPPAPVPPTRVKPVEEPITEQPAPQDTEVVAEHPPPAPPVVDLEAGGTEAAAPEERTYAYTDMELRQLRRFDQTITELPTSLYWNPHIVQTLLQEWEQVKRLLQLHVNGAFQRTHPIDSDSIHFIQSEVLSHDF